MKTEAENSTKQKHDYTDSKRVWQNIESLLKNQDSTWKALAEKVGIQATYIASLKGQNSIISLRTAALIASALNVSIDYLYYNESNSPKANSTVPEGWNPQNWLKQFKAASSKKDVIGIHTLRKQVFSDTQSIIENQSYTIEQKRIDVLPPPNSIYYSHNLLTKSSSLTDMTVKISRDDCLEIAENLQASNPVVICDVNRRLPYSGAEPDTGTQEAYIMRVSNYSETLYAIKDKAYPMNKKYGGIYSPAVTVFRAPETEGYRLLADPFTTNFIAVAALFNPKLDENGKYLETSKEGMTYRIRAIFNIAIKNHYKILIIPAFGCGKSANPPLEVANIFKKLLLSDEYRGQFEEVWFSVPDSINYKIFKKVLIG